MKDKIILVEIKDRLKKHILKESSKTERHVVTLRIDGDGSVSLVLLAFKLRACNFFEILTQHSSDLKGKKKLM